MQMIVISKKYRSSSFPECFCIFQRTIDQYNNLQIPKEKCNLFNNVNNVILVSLLLTLNTFHTFLYLLALGKCTLWMVAFTNFICVSYIYLHIQQKQLSSHTKLGATGGGGGEGGNNLIDMIVLYDFHQFSLESINLRDMVLSYDSINRRFHHQISPDQD